jgi:hypothetical protein
MTLAVLSATCRPKEDAWQEMKRLHFARFGRLITHAVRNAFRGWHRTGRPPSRARSNQNG